MEGATATQEKRPLVTFALFAYNQEKYVREAVEGAFSQTYEPLEIILSDDCSSDRTFEIMQEMAAAYKGPHCVRARRNIVNIGLSGHVNRVIELSHGEFISWAAGDDISLPERTAALVEAIASDENCVGSHSSVIEIDPDGKFIKQRDCRAAREISLGDVINHGESLVTQSHAFRASVFRRFGRFNENLTHEGKAMAFRECVLGSVKYIDAPLTKYRMDVGISNYSGRDVGRRKYGEPIKYTKWYLTAFQQMLADADAVPERLSAEDLKKIKRKIKFYSNLLDVNLGSRIFSAIVENAILFPTNMETIRASLRRLIPDNIYRFRIRWIVHVK